MSFFNKTVWEPRRFDIGAGPPLGQLAPFTRSRFICVSLKISSSENGVCPPLPTSETGLLLQTAFPAGFGADLKGSGSLELQQSTSSGWQEGAKRRACSPSREARQSLLRVLTRTAPGPKRAGKAEQCRAIQSLARGRSSSVMELHVGISALPAVCGARPAHLAGRWKKKPPRLFTIK